MLLPPLRGCYPDSINVSKYWVALRVIAWYEVTMLGMYLLVTLRMLGQPVTPLASLDSNAGWLYPGGQTRIVRFDLEAYYPGQPEIINLGQRSGFIVMFDDTFYISESGLDSTKLFEYKNGVLTKTSQGMEIGNYKKTLKSGEALSYALDEAVCDGLGDFYLKSLLNSATVAKIQTIRQRGRYGTEIKAILGIGRGALQSYTITWGGSLRTECTFTVITGREHHETPESGGVYRDNFDPRQFPRSAVNPPPGGHVGN